MKSQRSRTDLGYIKKINELKPGDILLFRADDTPIAKVIGLIGTLVPQKNGHFDTTHAAICVGNDDKGPIISHLVGSGYIKESLPNFWARDQLDDRSFIVFQPKNSTVAKRMADIAGDEKKLSQVKWELTAGIQASYTFATAFLSSQIDKEQKISNSSFCSKFIIQIMKSATQSKDLPIEERVYYPDIRSTVIPKTLEAFLYKLDDQYSYLVYPGKKPYTKIKAIIKDQIIALKKDQSKKGQDLYDTAQEAFKEIKKSLKKCSKNKLDKTILLIQHMLPILTQIEKVLGSQAASTVLESARKIGIFKKDVIGHPKYSSATDAKNHSMS